MKKAAWFLFTVAVVTLALVFVIAAAQEGTRKTLAVRQQVEGSPELRTMEGFAALLDRFGQMSQEPSTVGVAAAIGANEMLKGDPQAAIAYYDSLLPEVKDPAVERTIRFLLADAYRNAGQKDESLAQLRLLITNRTGQPTTQPAAAP